LDSQQSVPVKQTATALDPITGLSIGQEAFARAYVANGGNGAQAARSAYASLETAHCNVASERGRQLLAKPHLRARIAELQGLPAPARAIEAKQLEDLERLAMLAFDEREPDIRRLVALRALTAGLADVVERREKSGEARMLVT
jgi:Terminase small subunit